MATTFDVQPDHRITEQFIAQWSSPEVFRLQSNVAKVNANVLSNKDEDLIIMDIGADKIFVAPAHVGDSEVKQSAAATISFLKDGQILENLSKKTQALIKAKKISRIACSAHGQIQNHKWVDHCAPEIAQELTAAGFQNDIGGYLIKASNYNYPFTMYNDAVSGGAFAFHTTRRLFPNCTNFIYFIVGGGVGGCYIDEVGNISAAEPGHVEWLPYPDDPKPEPCPQAGPKFCGEVYSKGPYIEKELALKYFGREIPGRELNTMLQDGDKIAEKVYQHGARNVANVLLGMLAGFNLMDNIKLANTIIVTHGGVADNVAPYNTMVQHYIMDFLKTKFSGLENIPIIATKELLAGRGDNAGALGAAFLAYWSERHLRSNILNNVVY